MCHSRLEFSFGPNVNFIIGRNGSGKSAVLTALCVGLGGKAHITNRGTNLKSFIKDGENYAVVQVQLRNKGPDAYRPNEYGSCIIVERKIVKDGAGSYKLKGENGKVISTRRDELLAILDQFNIQVDNPVSVLNQQTSRSFLSSKSPKDKYTFFLKATQLDQIKQSNADAAEKLQLAEDMLTRKQEMLPQLKHEVDEWENRWRFLQSVQGLQDKVMELKKEYAWALVIEKETECDKANEACQEKLEARAAVRTEIAQAEEELKEKVQQRSNQQKKLDDMIKEMQALEKEKNEIKGQIHKANNELKMKGSEKQNAQNEESSAASDEETLKKQIEELIKAEPHDNSTEKELRNKQINDYEEQKKELLAMQATKGDYLKKVRDSLANYTSQIQACEHHCRAFDSEMTSIKQRMADIEGSRKNHLQRYGQCIPALVDNIEKAHERGLFRKKPLGPIGAYVTLRDPKWAMAVEASLGNILESFCCDNHDDEAVLKQLIRTTITNGQQLNTLVGSFEKSVYNVSKNKVSGTKHHTILDMLVIEDPAVANFLIDHKNIESILLIENKVEARNIMTYSVPKNCLQAFTVEGDQIFPTPSFRYYANRKKYSKYLTGSVDDKISELKDRYQKLEVSRNEKLKEIEELAENTKQNRVEARNTEAQIRKVSQEIVDVNSRLNNLLCFVEPEPVDVSSLEDEVRLAHDKRLELRQKVEALTKEIAEGKDNLSKLRAVFKEKDQQMEALVVDSEPKKTEIEELCEGLSARRKAKQALEAKEKQLLNEAEGLKKKWENIQNEVESMRRKTEEVCARISTTRAPYDIYCNIEEVKKNLKKEERNWGSKDEVTQRYVETKTKYKRILDEISECSEMMKKIEHGVRLRQESFVSFRKQLAIRIKYLFNTCMSTRKFMGKINFHHKLGTLTFNVQPDENVKQEATDMKSLSGGERSFSTVCFILALWDSMESPFRILDEFDVFMDMVNRSISMDLMMDTASLKTGNQFIFLSPLEMTRNSCSARVQICKMPDPER